MDIKGDKEMKTIEEQQIAIMKERIAIIEHFKSGGQVEYYCHRFEEWKVANKPNWDWDSIRYRIKEQKKTVTIEKWLLKKDSELRVEEGNSDWVGYWNNWEKIKLLDSYEVEI